MPTSKYMDDSGFEPAKLESHTLQGCFIDNQGYKPQENINRSLSM
jgi:hypothetical protein